MTLNVGAVNWAAVGVCFVVGQIFLTLYFTVLFGKPWAEAYAPGKTPAEHTAEVPKWTYGVAAACTLALVSCLGVLQASLGVAGVGDALLLGGLVSVGLVAASIAPGYGFLRRWKAAGLVVGSQVGLVLISSLILGAWR